MCEHKTLWFKFNWNNHSMCINTHIQITGNVDILLIIDWLQHSNEQLVMNKCQNKTINCERQMLNGNDKIVNSSKCSIIYYGNMQIKRNFLNATPHSVVASSGHSIDSIVYYECMGSCYAYSYMNVKYRWLHSSTASQFTSCHKSCNIHLPFSCL